MLTHVDVFSGIGGFALAAQWAGFETVAFVEIEPYAQELIKQNFGAVADAQAGHGSRLRNNASQRSETQHRQDSWAFPRNGISCKPVLYSDILTFDGTPYRGATLLTGGFPCQPFSQAGKRRGAADDRALWPEMFRVIQEVRPAWVLGENVAGIVTMELDRVLSDLEGEGYAVQPLIIPACAVDAKHRRDRVWIIANASGGELREQSGRSIRQSRAGALLARVNGSDEFLADAARDEQGRKEQRAFGERAGECGESESMANADRGDGYGRSSDVQMGRQWFKSEATANGNAGRIEWLPEPDVGRVAYGIPARVDRLKGLGNAIVPQAAYEIVRVIAGIESMK